MEALRQHQYLVVAITTAADALIFLSTDRDAAHAEAGKVTNATANRAANAAQHSSGTLIRVEVVTFENGRPVARDIVLIRDLIRELHPNRPDETKGRAE